MDLSKESSQSSNEDIKLIKLIVKQDNTVMSNGKVYGDDELLTMLRLAMKEAQQYAIILTAKDDVTYQRYLSLMSFLKTNKSDNISLGIKNEVKK